MVLSRNVVEPRKGLVLRTDLSTYSVPQTITSVDLLVVRHISGRGDVRFWISYGAIPMLNKLTSASANGRQTKQVKEEAMTHSVTELYLQDIIPTCRTFILDLSVLWCQVSTSHLIICLDAPPDVYSHCTS